MTMDYSGNIFDEKGNYVGNDYFASPQFAEMKAANDALQAAVAENRGAEGTPRYGATNSATTQALLNYTNAGRGPGRSATTASQDPAARPNPWMSYGSGSMLTLRGPNGETRTLDPGDHVGIDSLTRTGWVPLNSNGNAFKIMNWKGGQMFIDPDTGQASPLNVLLGGPWLPEQMAEMPAFNQYMQAQGISQPPAQGNPPPTGVSGGDPEGWIQSLLQGSMGRIPGTDAVANQFLQTLYPHLAQQLVNTETTRDQTLNRLLFGTPGDPNNPAERGAVGALNNLINLQGTGLSEPAKSALLTQAMSDIPKRYDDASKALKVELARRGAIGQQGLPGSAGDIIRGYEPLMAERENARTQAMTNTVLADEQARQQNYQTSANAANQLSGIGGLISTTYNPTQSANTLMGALQGGLGAYGQGNQMFGTAGSLVNALTGNQQTSMTNLILGSILASAGAGAAGGLLGKIFGNGGDTSKGSSIFNTLSGIFGDGPGASSVQTPSAFGNTPTNLLSTGRTSDTPHQMPDDQGLSGDLMNPNSGYMGGGLPAWAGGAAGGTAIRQPMAAPRRVRQPVQDYFTNKVAY